MVDECQTLLEELNLDCSELESLRLSVLEHMIKRGESTKKKDTYKVNIIEKFDNDIEMLDLDPLELDKDFINDLNYHKLILNQMNGNNKDFKLSYLNDDN